MIHLVFAESKKGYDWFERKNDHLYAHSGSCCDYSEILFAKTNLMFCYRGSVGSANLNYILYYPEVSGSIPRTEKELNSVLEKEFKSLLDLSKDKTLYIFTTSEQVLRFFRIRLAELEMKSEDLLVSFIEEFDYDENDFNKIDVKFDQSGFCTLDQRYPMKMFTQTVRDCARLLRAQRVM